MERQQVVSGHCGCGEKLGFRAREFPVIHYIHVINANAGWARVPESLYNSCNVTTCVTRLLALVTRLRMAYFTVLLSRAPHPFPFFISLVGFFSISFLRKPKMLTIKEHKSNKNIHVNIFYNLFWERLIHITIQTFLWYYTDNESHNFYRCDVY